MTCARCAELEEEVAYLRGELALTHEAETYARLRAHLRSRPGSHRGGAIGLITALYSAHGRVLTTAQIMDAVPATKTEHEDRMPDISKVWVCSARKALGHDSIENVWGKGYRMTPAGIERVRAIVEPADTSQVAAA
jgi:hypothetical protein